jgi:CheY-like chemotaxis protein
VSTVSTASRPHRKVLVVEDTTDIRELLADILASEGYVVDACANGAEALGRIAAERYDLVLLDLMMPVMDGLQLLEELRRAGGRPPPVVVMSAFERFRGEVAELGARAFISKPVDIDRLLDAVEQYLAPTAAT